MTGLETDPPVAADDVLRVEDLSVHFTQRVGLFGKTSTVRAVDHVSFTLRRGEILALVGESGSGKSSTARGLLRLVPAAGGRVLLGDDDLLRVSGRALRQLRKRVQMVFQDPYSSLDPSTTVGSSVAEPLRVHTDLDRTARAARVEDLFELVGLPRSYAGRYPYEFSGGQRQRIAIARALALDPDVVVCDEAVSALDVSTQNQVIELIQRLQAQLGTAFLFITHDLGIVRNIAQRTAVMYLGQIVEEGPTDGLFEHPQHPYTEALLSAVPIANPRLQRERQRVIIEGDLPNPAAPPAGCRFHTRCPHVMDICKVEEPVAASLDGGMVACHLRSSTHPATAAPWG